MFRGVVGGVGVAVAAVAVVAVVAVAAVGCGWLWWLAVAVIVIVIVVVLCAWSWSWSWSFEVAVGVVAAVCGLCWFVFQIKAHTFLYRRAPSMQQVGVPHTSKVGLPRVYATRVHRPGGGTPKTDTKHTERDSKSCCSLRDTSCLSSGLTHLQSELVEKKTNMSHIVLKFARVSQTSASCANGAAKDPPSNRCLAKRCDPLHKSVGRRESVSISAAWQPEAVVSQHRTVACSVAQRCLRAKPTRTGETSKNRTADQTARGSPLPASSSPQQRPELRH